MRSPLKLLLNFLEIQSMNETNVMSLKLLMINTAILKQNKHFSGLLIRMIRVLSR